MLGMLAPHLYLPVVAYYKLYRNSIITVCTQKKSVNLSVKLFENCVRGYIMVPQKGDWSLVVRDQGREGGVRIMLSPFRGFYDMQSEVDRLFNETFGRLARGRERQGGGQQLTQ